ncbi:hypothetical protein MANY_24380 [Mycolicibacterium anyangense]|uniref:DUF1214 domain-containing protein n=1 Tax=Mycolicibacterium anyangense TaxID=1431246 RepID=A0A6N4WD28_9MYCO|nr:DUF1214 domain-containing protein [Mycolicibacterium anyangense]BBZ77101.1 hypothetical protein MANY_24380 [Mycolicibacterium anyangense]
MAIDDDQGLASWAEYVDLLKDAADLETTLWDPDDVDLRAALYRQFAMSLSQGYFLYFAAADPRQPDWVPFENSAFLAQPNPDAVYHYAAVDGTGVYRIRGRRGTVPVVGFATGRNLFGMSDSPGPGFDNYDADQLTLDEAGFFDVVLSAERPAGYQGDWLYLNPDTQFVIVRQFSYDWGNELDATLGIVRLDEAPPSPRVTATDVDARLRGLFGQYTAGLSKVTTGYMKNLREREGSDQVVLTDFSGLGNGADWPQAYYECRFELTPDEALIVETDLPEHHVYWNIQVIDALWNQVELIHHQSSLNGFQAHIDSDGKFRAVLSTTDPGVPNWLDTGGELKGMLIGRWYRCSSHPTPTVSRVKVADVRAHLPADTPLITTEQRTEVLRQRALGAQLRRRW